MTWKTFRLHENILLIFPNLYELFQNSVQFLKIAFLDSKNYRKLIIFYMCMSQNDP